MSGVARVWSLLGRVTANLVVVAAASFLLLTAPQAQAQTDKPASNGAQILQAFDQQQVERVNASGLSEHKKHVIIFMIGVPLMLLLLTTGGLGIAVGVYGKQHLFVHHMVLAGLTMTLAVVHVVVSLVWFFPF